MSAGEDQLLLFRSLFKGRRDVYAKRWETKDKSGYAPAYDIDWSGYELHKASGGTIKDYPHKTYSNINDGVIRGHLEGKEVIGIYPLLENNTSWFAHYILYAGGKNQLRCAETFPICCPNFEHFFALDSTSSQIIYKLNRWIFKYLLPGLSRDLCRGLTILGEEVVRVWCLLVTRITTIYDQHLP